MAQAEALPEPAEDGIMEWITYKYNQLEGFEIGTTNPSLMPSLFAEQSPAWGFHALNHVTKVIRKIHHFNYKVLQYCLGTLGKLSESFGTAARLENIVLKALD